MTDCQASGAFRKPRITDVPGIKRLIDSEVSRNAHLPRTAAELYEALRDFTIYEDAQGIGGCCALHIDLDNLAEVRSLVVRSGLRGKGVGKRLLQACLDEARSLGIGRVYALTRIPDFFANMGFSPIDRHDLPHKVFRDCVRCPMFPDCDEVAVISDMTANQSQEG